MNKMRALLFALAAFVLVVPSAFAADFVGGPDVTVPPGVNTIGIIVSNDADLRGVGFSYELVNIDASSVAVNSATVITAALGSHRVVAYDATSGAVFMAGRGGADDLPADPVGAPLVEIEVDVQGVTGNQAMLIISGTDPWPNSPIFVDTDSLANRTLLGPDTIVISIQALATADINAVCPPPGTATVEGGAVAIGVGTTIAEGVFQSLDFIGMSKDGSPAVPVNAPQVIGLNLVEAPDAEDLIFYWVTAPGDAGTWDICFEASNDGGVYDTSCATVVVEPQTSDVALWVPKLIEFTGGGGAFADDIQLSITTASDSTFGLTLPFQFEQIYGGAFFDVPLAIPDVVYSPSFSVFESQNVNVYANDAVPPDSLLGGCVDFGGAALDPGTYPDAMTLNATWNGQEGIVEVDSAGDPGHAPSNYLRYDQVGGLVTAPSYGTGCYPFTYVRNLPPTVICPVDAYGVVVFGNFVSIPGFSYDDPDAAPGPYTFSIVSITKNGSPDAPINDPVFVGDEFQWQTAADDADVGIWEFCVQVNDGADNSVNTCCFTVEVIGQTPFVFWIDTITVNSNADVTVCVNFLKEAGPLPEQLAGGFDLLICYDASILTFNGATVGQALLDHGWEYWTYRVESTNPGKIRIVAIADMNNSNRHPDGENPNGVITCLNFHTSNDRTVACQKSPIRFCWEDCGDNAVSSRDGYVLFVASLEDGGIIDVSGEQIMCLDPDPFGYNATVVCDGCPSDKYEVVPFVTFRNGAIRIICPGEIDATGDLNLNGLAYEIGDAVLYSNYLIYGSSVLDPDYYEAQIAASDVNRDGSPLTVADLVYLIRVITGDAMAIPEGMGGPKVAATVGTVDVTSAQAGTRVSVSASSESRIGAGLFVFKYDNTEISSVTAVGRASDMSVMYDANDGELRVLLLPQIGDDQIGRQAVADGKGEILNIATTGEGRVELVSVEAATFMGGALEANVSAKVLPTAYALYQNYPNPFNPSTSLAMDLPTASQYTLSIYNIAGQVVKSFSGAAEAGTLTITWDGTNNAGSKVASGVYFYRFETSDFSAVRKMVLMK